MQPGLQHQDQVALRRGEVVNIAGVGQTDRRRRFQDPVRRQSPDDRLGPGNPQVPDPAVRFVAGMRQERHPFHVGPQGVESPGGQRVRIHRQRRARLPQRPDLTARLHHRGVGGIDIIRIGNGGPLARRAAETRLDPNAAPVVNASTQETGGGKFFNIVLIALLVIMGLVLVALLAVLSLLSKLAGTNDAEGNSSLSAIEVLKENLKGLSSNKTIRSAVIWLFIILGTKATLDGMYSIGVHQGYAPKQPIAFSHKLHAGEMQINCANCHTGVYKGKQAGIPSSSICMNCHNTIKRESPEIQKIYTALEKDQPVEWVRVHNLPDLAYFNHSQHTNVAELDCENCHGEVNKMEVVQQRKTLTMGWCIDCHKKTDVNSKGNAYYDALLTAHNSTSKETMKVEDIGGLECAKCHY